MRIRRPLKVAIATTGRFHVLDLARELDALGYEVALYTIVPAKRAQAFGLPARAHRFLPELIPLAAACRFGPKAWRENFDRALYSQFNRAVISRLQRCDVFIGMSGIVVEAADYARNKFGAKIFLERGSRHIHSQAEILNAIPGAVPVPRYAVERELEGYEIADCVVVPSAHVEQSFTERGFPPWRLFRNPYGVDLRRFHPSAAPSARASGRIAFVGRWSLQKGADLVTRFVKADQRISLLHAGAVGDCAFPEGNRFRSIGHVDQTRLPDIYGQVRMLVLPSRQEGLSLVLIQALACGLPIVCSDRSGGEDLKALVARPEAVAVARYDDYEDFARAAQEMLFNSDTLVGTDLLGERGRDTLTWRAYGQRYAQRLEREVKVGG